MEAAALVEVAVAMEAAELVIMPADTVNPGTLIMENGQCSMGSMSRIQPELFHNRKWTNLELQADKIYL